MVSIQSLFPFNYRLLPLLLHPLHFNHLSILNSVVSPQVLLWNQRLEHPCSKLLQSALSSFNNTIKIYVNNDICSQCTYCISAKMHKFPFPKHVMSSTFPLQLVHSDVWGLAPVTSMLGYRFYVIFVDDFTRFTQLFLLKHKSKVFIVFLHFKALVENQFGSTIKILRTDGRGEYTSNHFKSFCLENGIQYQLSCPYSPQQNGVAERNTNKLLRVVCLCFTNLSFLLLFGVMHLVPLLSQLIDFPHLFLVSNHHGKNYFIILLLCRV